MSSQYRRRVGAARPSHLMYTSGVGALIDLPNFSVLVRGLDEWQYDPLIPEWEPILEPRLLAAVHAVGLPTVEQLRPAPWLAGLDQDPAGPAARVGVPTMPFPSWLRCTACSALASIESSEFGFENDKPSRPHDARFCHSSCTRGRTKKPLAVAARFVLACSNGHIDDFPYAEFVHQGGRPCVPTPQLRMDDRGGNVGANVEIQCISCQEPTRRNMREALGDRNRKNLPNCRGRHPHLGTFERCTAPPSVLVLGASNQWFAQTLSALAVPRTAASELETLVEKHWEALSTLPPGMLGWARANTPSLGVFERWTDEDVYAAIDAHREVVENGPPPDTGYPDLRTPEWEIFSATSLPASSDEFTLRRDPDGVPAALSHYFADVIQVERLREVRALVGFTRLDAPDPEDPNLVHRARLARDNPHWVPASEVRGEGIFLRVPDDVLADWESRIAGSDALECHREAYGSFRRSRYSGRLPGDFDEMAYWPEGRYIALHTLSHLLIRAISLECGYSAASLSERIYAGTADDPRSGILIYTAVPDADGTLGGLVTQAEPTALVRHVRRALGDAMRCSSDPLCAERTPSIEDGSLHGAACHVCLFVSETTCERGNRFLDRRFVVPIDRDEPELALFPKLS
jgi:hypothetical protein